MFIMDFISIYVRFKTAIIMVSSSSSKFNQLQIAYSETNDTQATTIQTKQNARTLNFWK